MAAVTRTDHDKAVISSGTFDLALRKQLAKGQSGKLKIGDQVTFTLTIFNQGTIDATGVEITDYIPAGLTLDDADWSAKGDKATLKTKLSLKAGAQTTVDITFKVNDKAASGQVINWAEISEQRGPDGEIIPDVDSTPNQDNHSEPGEEDNLDDDDVIDQNGNNGGDEDDHDPAVIEIGAGPGDRQDRRSEPDDGHACGLAHRGYECRKHRCGWSDQGRRQPARGRGIRDGLRRWLDLRTSGSRDGALHQ